MQSNQEPNTSKSALSAPSPPDASATAAVEDTTADTGSDVTDQVQNTEHIPLAGGKSDKPSDVQLTPEPDKRHQENDVSNAEDVAPKGLAKELIAFSKNKLSLDELRRAFESAKTKGLDANDPAYQSAELLISKMGEEIAEFNIEGESDEDLITFTIWDQGGQQVK